MRKRSTITHPVAGILPEELMMEIIVRIPVRFLGRLRCVCKSWNALITDPQFALELIDHNKNTQQKILFPCFSPHARNSAKPYDRNFKECIVAGSINGIVCLASLCRPGTRFVALWNPSIKYWKPIHLPDTGDCNWFESIGLAFDSLANDYKVIRLLPLLRQMTSSSSSISRVEVYSASQDSWSVVHSEIPFFTTQLKCSLIVKGVPYWSRNYHSSYCVYDNFQSNVIASFDPRTGLYKKISYPQILLNEKTSVHPFNLMDSLAILMYSPGEKPNQTFHVYALDDENSCATTWINLCSTPAPTVQLNKDLRILRCFEDPAGKTIVVGWNPHQSDFFLYDLKTDCLIESIGLDAYRTRWDESYHHVESLVYIPGMEPIPTEDG
ncbi:putative F-box protein At1g32420 [Apium graveolens]|uniref:putative F-box protein At1g32420 n=1 Tax=Apium graveolens TaxID=4045 RepID=UPI003D7A2127